MSDLNLEQKIQGGKMTNKKSHLIFVTAVIFFLSVIFRILHHNMKNQTIKTEELTEQFLDSNPRPVQISFVANKTINPTPYSMLNLLDNKIDKKIKELLGVTETDTKMLIETLKMKLKKESLDWVSINELLETLIKLNNEIKKEMDNKKSSHDFKLSY